MKMTVFEDSKKNRGVIKAIELSLRLKKTRTSLQTGKSFFAKQGLSSASTCDAVTSAMLLESGVRQTKWHRIGLGCRFPMPDCACRQEKRNFFDPACG
jgi:hypothetical protein